MVRRSLCELYLCYRAWEHILLRRWQSTQKGSYDEPDLAGRRSGVGNGIWSLHAGVSKTLYGTGSRPCSWIGDVVDGGRAIAMDALSA